VVVVVVSGATFGFYRFGGDHGMQGNPQSKGRVPAKSANLRRGHG
jgi:hypothetical protein